MYRYDAIGPWWSRYIYIYIYLSYKQNALWTFCAREVNEYCNYGGRGTVMCGVRHRAYASIYNIGVPDDCFNIFLFTTLVFSVNSCVYE